MNLIVNQHIDCCEASSSLKFLTFSLPRLNQVNFGSIRTVISFIKSLSGLWRGFKYPLSPIFLTGNTHAHRFSAPFWVEQTFSKIFTTTDHPVLAHLLLSTLTSYLLPQNWIWKNVSHEHFISLVVSTRLFFHFSLSLSTVTFSDCGASLRYFPRST